MIIGTVVTIEGPRFSSKAESFMFRSWKADVINMTTVPEVVLAKELGKRFKFYLDLLFLTSFNNV